MNQAALFLSRFLLGLWIVLVVASVSLLLANAPNVPDYAPFASVSINAGSDTIYLPNRSFDCAETAQQFQCQTTIQNRLLTLTLTKGTDYQYDFSHCRAHYNGQPVDCREEGLNYAPILAYRYEITQIKGSPQQWRELQQKYRGINVLMQLGEERLLRISAALSLVAGIIAAFFSWFHPGLFSKAFVGFACGMGVGSSVWGLLGSVPYDVVTSYGFTFDWGWVVNGVAILTAIATTLTTTRLLWRRGNRLSKSLIVISSSVGIFNLCLLSFSFLTNFFGAETQYEIILVASICLATAAAILLWQNTNQSIKRYLILGSSFGAIALSSYLFLGILLGLGYAD